MPDPLTTEPIILGSEQGRSILEALKSVATGFGVGSQDATRELMANQWIIRAIKKP